VKLVLCLWRGQGCNSEVSDHESRGLHINREMVLAAKSTCELFPVAMEVFGLSRPSCAVISTLPG